MPLSLACYTTLRTYAVRNFFFFQAKDGIRDVAVTGVQTCALPILGSRPAPAPRSCSAAVSRSRPRAQAAAPYRERDLGVRSEERRVGKEGRSRWSPYH